MDIFVKEYIHIMMRSFQVFTLIFVLALTSETLSQTDTTVHQDQQKMVLPAFTLSGDDLDGLEQSQNISGLLQSSRDIFVTTAGYNFGSLRYWIRGYGSEYTTVMINGTEVNDPGSGRAYWASWGGLNDAFRNQEIKTGITASNLAFGGIGGVTNMEARASSFRKQFKVTASRGNRSYNNRLMFIASTGLMDNGWAVTLSGSHRWAQEGYVEGTFYDAWSYFLSVEKKINKHHSLGLIAFGAPNKRGRSGVSTQEAYDLAGTNYYNPYWGYQDGEKRNARVSSYHQPMFMFTHYWDLSDKTSINSTGSYNFGKGSSTALNWVETGDPRPDYYRNLPSYYSDDEDSEEYDYRLYQWVNNQEFRQLKWDHFYFANSKFLFPVNNADGIEGNNVSILRSKYIVEDWRNDKSQFGFNTHINNKLNENITLSGGLNFTWYKGYHYKLIDDLLGGEYWLDIDKYADQEPFENTAQSQSDLRHPNRLVKEGDRFGYDYNSNIDKYLGFAQAEFSYNKFDFYIGGELSHTTFWRTGNMQNGLFPDDSYGNSEKQQFTNYGFKGGVVYKISGKNYLSVNAAYLTKAPFFRTAYISPRTRNQVISNLKSEKILSGDINYIHRSEDIKARTTLYYTRFDDQTWARSFYHDDLNSFVNYQMTGVDKLHMGLEVGIEANVSSVISLSGILGLGRNIYDSRPVVTISQDNDAEILAENRTVYLKNYYSGRGPQTIGSMGIKYNSPDYWFASFNINYFDNIYLSINPDRRTEEALSGYYEGDLRIEEVLDQQKLTNGITLDFFGGKSWKVNDVYIGVVLSVNNILNNKNIRSGGFEQYRFDSQDIHKFPPKYFYLYGRTYFINLSVSI